jgi:serine-type D-Ala-D-Ala carboxypeptidase (penicillin-binding protein 5/6)
MSFKLRPIYLFWIGGLLIAAGSFLVFSLHESPRPVVASLDRVPSSRGNPLPQLSAKFYFAMDLDSQYVFTSLNADQEVYPASTTKMMTALVVLDAFPLDQEIVVSRSYPEGSHLGLTRGVKITVEKLLYAMLVQSANDAAEILAENYPGGRPVFIQAMNVKASALGLRHTHFVNPTGLDETGHYSSAADLVRLAEVLVQDRELSRIVSTENAVLSVSDDGSSYIVSNVNQLLGKVPGVLGIKTGFTDGAGQALVTLVNRDNHPVLITVLGSQDRFTDSQTLIEWVYSNFTWPAGS